MGSMLRREDFASRRNGGWDQVVNPVADWLKAEWLLECENPPWRFVG